MECVRQITKEKEIPGGGAPGTHTWDSFCLLLNTKLHMHGRKSVSWEVLGE